MKRIRGFARVFGSEEWEEEDEEEFLEDVFLEHGFGAECNEEECEVQAYTCPRCKRVLFEADVSLHGVIYIKCRRCRREEAVETAPLMRRIGFIDS